MKHASLVVTDSAASRKKQQFLGTPCVTVRENTERPVTVESGTKYDCGEQKQTPSTGAIRRQLGRKRENGVPKNWDGRAAVRIIDTLVRRHYEKTSSRLALCPHAVPLEDRCSCLEPNLRTMDNHLEAKIPKLLAYCQANNWAGYDPYDAANSKAFAALPFLNSRLPRLVLTQVLKRSPLNIRAVAYRRPKNPKAIALFLSAFLKLSRIGVVKAGDLSEPMIERLVALRSQGVPHWCWDTVFRGRHAP